MHIGSNLPPKGNLRKRTKVLLPKCPLFGGSTVISMNHIFFIVVGASKTLHIAVSAGKREYLTY